MGIKVTVDFDAAGVSQKVENIKTNKEFGMFLAEEAENGMDQFVPKRSGHLIDSAEPSPFQVEYTAPYAKYPYHGRNMTIRKDFNIKATSYWDKAYASARIGDLARAATAYLKRM